MMNIISEYWDRYRVLFSSVFFLSIGCFLAVYAVYIGPREVMVADLALLKVILEREAVALERLKRETREEIASEFDIDLTESLSHFLGQINKIAEQNAVIIRELLPTEENLFKFSMVITADYFTFLWFASSLESLDVVINDLQVRPYDPTQEPAIHAISFSITPRGQTEVLSGSRVDTLKDLVAAPDKRNPFRRYAFNAEKTRVLEELDLTYVHKLTGVSREGTSYIATINGREYVIGDGFPGDAGPMTVTGVTSDQVRLSEPTVDGERKYILGFRNRNRAGSRR